MERGLLTPRGTRSCTKCSSSEVTSFCSCLEPPALLCAKCIQPHYEESRYDIHTIFPVKAFTFYKKPGYIDDLKRRLKTKERAVDELRKNLILVRSWKKDMTDAAEAMKSHISEWAGKVARQTDELVLLIESDISEAEEELESTLYDPSPILSSPLAASMRHYVPGTLRLFSLLSDFKSLTASHKSFLGALTFNLQVEHPEYSLQNRLSAKAGDLVLGVYEKIRADFTTPLSRAAREKFGPYQRDSDESTKAARGPLPHDNGVYTGEWNGASQRHGFGAQQWRDGTAYEGQWRNDQMHGRGRQIWYDGTVYEGDYQFSKRHGFGHIYNSDGGEYIGCFAKGKQHGFGMYKFGDMSKSQCYFGEYVHDEREGRGAILWRDGSMYCGEFSEGDYHGPGCEVDPNCRVHSGVWVSGELHNPSSSFITS